MNPKAIGNISEAKILAEFVALGWSVLIPFGDNEPYDLVIDRGQGFEKVQVKTARRDRQGCIAFNAYSIAGKTSPKKIGYQGKADWFAVYFAEFDQVYIVAVEEVVANTVFLRLDPPRTNGDHGLK